MKLTVLFFVLVSQAHGMTISEQNFESKIVRHAVDPNFEARPISDALLTISYPKQEAKLQLLVQDQDATKKRVVLALPIHSVARNDCGVLLIVARKVLAEGAVQTLRVLDRTTSKCNQDKDLAPTEVELLNEHPFPGKRDVSRFLGLRLTPTTRYGIDGAIF